MRKKTIIPAVLLILVAAGIIVFFYRYSIIQYSANALIRSFLPGYVNVDKISFDARKSRVALEGFRILNPSGFTHKYLIEIEALVCEYKLKGKTILDGFEVLSPTLKNAVLNVERRADGKSNLLLMPDVIESAAGDAQKNQPKRQEGAKDGSAKKTSDVLKLPKTYLVKNGKVIFIDSLGFARPYLITLSDIDASLSLELDESYSKVIRSSSVGQGLLNAHKNEVFKWEVHLDPNTPKLTMSNRFEVNGVNMIVFEPYYEKYSPFIFEKGKFSGTLVLDFDNGNIGSTNEIRLSDLVFYVKPGYENAQVFEAPVQDLVKYFTSAFGEVVFDFKIKGDMSEPKFYLGPISKKAIGSMMIDKITSAIEGTSQPAGSSSSSSGSSDIDKAKEYIKLFKGIINKK